MTMKYVLRSRLRFTIFVAFSIIIAVSALNLLLGTTATVSGDTGTTYQTINITYGDTFWSIADEFMPDDMDIREAIYELRQINGMSASDQLIVGQELLVPEN